MDLSFIHVCGPEVFRLYGLLISLNDSFFVLLHFQSNPISGQIIKSYNYYSFVQVCVQYRSRNEMHALNVKLRCLSKALIITLFVQVKNLQSVNKLLLS